MENNSFGPRLKSLIGKVGYKEFGEKIGVTEAAVKKYVAGRVPPFETLLQIQKETSCSLHWLLTGKGDVLYSGWSGTPLSEQSDLDKLLYIIANEQGPIVFADAQVAAEVQSRTVELLKEYLLNDALLSNHLITKPLMSDADWRRSQKFTFVKEKAPSIEEQIRQLIARETSGKNVSSVAQNDEIRDMIRQIIREEIEPKRPLIEHDFKEGEQKPQRKAG